ncbi:MAG: hypothetical protein BHV81_16775 [Butyricimonas synergistica]|nr:MAG: hypothetical protein BHV81_16775 [Butyricimonas synergistica]
MGNTRVKVVAFRLLVPADFLGVGALDIRQADDVELHLMLHLETEQGAGGAVRAGSDLATCHHEVGGGVVGVGTLVVAGLPFGDKLMEEIRGGVGGQAVWIVSVRLVATHIRLIGIIGKVEDVAPFGGVVFQLGIGGERPSGAVVGEAEIGSGYSQVVQVAGGVHLGVHDVQPDLVALGKPGGIVGDGDSERGGRAGAVARGSIIERVVAGAGCCQHQEQEQHRSPV